MIIRSLFIFSMLPGLLCLHRLRDMKDGFCLHLLLCSLQFRRFVKKGMQWPRGPLSCFARLQGLAWYCGCYGTSSFLTMRCILHLGHFLRMLNRTSFRMQEYLLPRGMYCFPSKHICTHLRITQGRLRRVFVFVGALRYGSMAVPSIAILVGYLMHRAGAMRIALVGLLAFVTFFSFVSQDAVTIDDARVGSSQKNVSEVSGWLHAHAANTPGFILISAASHDAIIFSSGLPMKKFIHEGTGAYWDTAITVPDHRARWIIMRTHDDNDLTWRSVKDTPGMQRYTKVESFPFADIYELKPEYLPALNVDANLPP